MLVLTMVPLAIASHGLSAPLTALPLGAWWSALAVLVLLLSASQLAVAIVNWLVPLLMPPRALPRMDYSFGIPSASRTLVVVPTMLSSAGAIDELVEALEVRFLANRDAHLHFALLTDFPDAAEQTLPSDEAAGRASARAHRGRSTVGTPSPRATRTHGDRFFLFHRPRRWNASEHVWMGHERKRGKLADLNALLRGGGHDRFSLIVGDTAALSGVRYVITLDTDTQLPRDAARKFVATMAHPLNRPRFGGRPEAPRVVGGYGILQPRVGVSLRGREPHALRPALRRRCRHRPVHARRQRRLPGPVRRGLVHRQGHLRRRCVRARARRPSAGEPRAQPRPARRLLRAQRRCSATSNWSRNRRRATTPTSSAATAGSAATGRSPPGCCRACRRRCPSRAATAALVRAANPLSPLSRLKILDNLRRSLVPASLTMLLLLGWSVLAQPGLWTLAALAVLFVPVLLGLVGDLLRKPDALRLACAPAAPPGVGSAAPVRARG